MRLGLRYVHGLRESVGRQLVAERKRRPFASIEDLFRRVPLDAAEARTLAEIGALHGFGVHGKTSRRAALWQVEAAHRDPGALYAGAEPGPEDEGLSPLPEMDARERMLADYASTSVTLGPHPIAFERARLTSEGVVTTQALKRLRHGRKVEIAGVVIARQRPENAGGVLFMSLEDETGIANIIVWPHLYAHQRMACIDSSQLRIFGTLQNQRGVIHVVAERIEPLSATPHAVVPRLPSRDFR